MSTRARELLWIGSVWAAIAACGPKPDAGRPGGAADPPRVPVGAGPTDAATGPRAIEAPPTLAAPLANDPTGTTIHRLSNGMTVYLSPDAQEPAIVAHIAVRAGSRHDPPHSTGLAHYLEHMVFKGTSQLGTLDYAKEKPHLDKIAALYADLRRPGADRDAILAAIDRETQASAAYAVPNELDQLYARIGITGLNAYTSDDATVYVARVPKNRVAQWARVEAARYADPVFRLFWPELEAVYEEKNRALDNPGRRVYETLQRALFPRHGYGTSSGIGETEHLKNPAYQDMEAFFARYYTPQNMAILLAGDVDASVLPVLEQAFAGFRRPAGAAVEHGELTALAGRAEHTVLVPSVEGVVLAWQLVAATHPDRLALEVADLLLHDGTSGILSRELLLPQRVASAGSAPTFLREAGYYELSAAALEGQTHAQLEQLLLGLVGKLQRGEFTDAELGTAILHADLAFQRQLESNDGRMALLSDAFVNGEAWRDVVTRIERMRRVTRDDVMRVAKQYLGGNFLVVKRVKGAEAPPKITKPAITPVKLDPSRQSAFGRAILEMPVAPIEPVPVREGTDYRRGALRTGPLVTVPNPRNGLFAVRYDFDFGRRDDRLACLALELLRVSGAGGRTPEATARELHELGLVVDTTCGVDRSSLTLSGLDANLAKGVEIVRSYLLDASFDDKILKARVAATLTERANAVAAPQAVASAQLAFARYGADSDFLIVPTNAQLRAATPAQLRALLRRFMAQPHRTAYFGPRDHDAAAQAVVLGKGGPKRARRPIVFRKPGAVFVTHQPTAQTHIHLTWPHGVMNDLDRAVGTLFSEYAGMLLYQEVREARGLAYTVRGYYLTGQRERDASSLYAYAGTQADKTHDALDAILETLRQPIDAARLVTAKEALAQAHRVARIPARSLAASVYLWEDQGEKADPRGPRTALALTVTAPLLEQWLAKALRSKVLVSITGDRKRLDDARLAALAPVTEVPVSKLFGYGPMPATN